MAGRDSTATSASPILAVCTAPVASRGSACVKPTGVATFVIKVHLPSRISFADTVGANNVVLKTTTKKSL